MNLKVSECVLILMFYAFDMHLKLIDIWRTFLFFFSRYEIKLRKTFLSDCRSYLIIKDHLGLICVYTSITIVILILR